MVMLGRCGFFCSWPEVACRVSLGLPAYLPGSTAHDDPKQSVPTGSKVTVKGQRGHRQDKGLQCDHLTSNL